MGIGHTPTSPETNVEVAGWFCSAASRIPESIWKRRKMLILASCVILPHLFFSLAAPTPLSKP